MKNKAITFVCFVVLCGFYGWALASSVAGELIGF